MALAGCASCGKNIHDFVIIPNSPDAYGCAQSNYAPPSSYEKDSKAWEITSKSKSTKGLCERCNELITSRLDDLITEASAEFYAYKQFIAKQDQPSILRPEGLSTISEVHLIKDLEGVGISRTHVAAEILHLKLVYENLEAETNNHWQDTTYPHTDTTFTRDWALDIAELQDNLDSLGGKVSLATNKVCVDAFQISVVQGLGAINNLRLGRLSNVIVEWDEINAAWGQTALLLYTLAKKLSFGFTQYKIVPMGFRPSIQHKDTSTSYPLYGYNSITFGRTFFWGTSSSTELDIGMEAFLFCVSELCARVLSLSATISLPYFIDKDRIGTRKGGLKSIRISGNSEEDWSKALKYMLTNLKRILVSLPSLVGTT